MVKEQEPEPTRPAPQPMRSWRHVSLTLELVALVAALQQREDLAVVAKALAVLGQLATTWVDGRRRR